MKKSARKNNFILTTQATLNWYSVVMNLKQIKNDVFVHIKVRYSFNCHMKMKVHSLKLWYMKNTSVHAVCYVCKYHVNHFLSFENFNFFSSKAHTWISCSDNETYLCFIYWRCFIVERFWYSLPFLINVYVFAWIPICIRHGSSCLKLVVYSFVGYIYI